MIVYLVTGREAYTVENYLRGRGRHQQGRIVTLPYEQLSRIKSLPVATYIFSDLDRLTRAQTVIAEEVYQTITVARPDLRLLNNPASAATRFNLLRSLYESGLNEFNVYRPDEIEDVRYPVFLRIERDHMGAKTPLIHTRAELDHAILDAIAMGAWPDNLMIVEFCDTVGKDGAYRKYAVWRFDKTYMARHLVIGNDWMQKVPKLDKGQRWPTEWVAEESKFLDSNPHLSQLRSTFELANIEYGRIDYGLKDGKVQVWEINTNPTCLTEVGNQLPEREHFDELIAGRFDEGWASIECPNPPGPPLPFELKSERVFRQPRSEWAWG